MGRHYGGKRNDASIFFSRWKYTISVCLLFLIPITALGFMVNGWNDCSNQGGTYVRTVFWYQCIDVKE